MSRKQGAVAQAIEQCRKEGNCSSFNGEFPEYLCFRKPRNPGQDQEYTIFPTTAVCMLEDDSRAVGKRSVISLSLHNRFERVFVEESLGDSLQAVIDARGKLSRTGMLLGSMRAEELREVMGDLVQRAFKASGEEGGPLRKVIELMLPTLLSPESIAEAVERYLTSPGAIVRTAPEEPPDEAETLPKKKARGGKQ